MAKSTCFPRVRGDVPFGLVIDGVTVWFSPRARGCSAADTTVMTAVEVFPACAGMFLNTNPGWRGNQSFPRVRGDVPGCSIYHWSSGMFSPRARGCSEWQP